MGRFVLLGSGWVRWLAGVLVLVVVGGSMLGLWQVSSVVAAERGLWETGDGSGLSAEDVGFSDIADAGVHRANVETLAERGILEGTECAAGQFCPEEPIERWVMAVWLVRAVDGTDPAVVESTRFVDVEAGVWWLPSVERLADLGITRGCVTEPARFCPNDPVTREQMASFLVRAFGLEAVLGNKFADVAQGNSHLADINALAAAGVTAGCATEPARYCPGQDTTRAEMATFLARALGIDSKQQPEGTTVPPDDEGPSLIEGDFKAIAAGASHTCGLLSDGAVVCWGANNERQAEPPDATFAAIASGWAFSCALDMEGFVTCWGANASGQTDVLGGRYISIAAGGWHACGVKTDQSVSCWGRNSDGQADPPEGRFVGVVAGSHHSCGLDTDHVVICWGRNDNGQTEEPAGEFKSLSAGDWHTCGVRTDSRGICWGSGGWGRTDVPTRLFTDLAGGWLHSCGIRTDRSVMCWGGNQNGQSDPPEGEFIAVSAGHFHSCGIRTNGTVTCWGSHPRDHRDLGEEQLEGLVSGRTHSCAIRHDHRVICWGINNNEQADPPDSEFQAVAVGDFHSCGIQTDQTVACWGGNWIEQALPPDGEFRSVTAGWSHSCGIRTDGMVNCWGNNDDGQADPPGGDFVAISGGGRHSCGIRTDQTVACWGRNRVGQTDSPSGTFTSVDAGGRHSCGIRTDQTVACWGSNDDGQANDPEGAFVAVAAGWDHSCGLRTDMTIVCWGDNGENATASPKGTFTAVTAGRSYSCGLRADGTVSCWGRKLVVPGPGDIEFTQRDLPDSGMCRPPGVSGTTTGFPLPGSAIPSVGTVRVAVLFLDFPDAEATHSTQVEAELGLPYTKQYLETVSYRQFKPHFEPFHQWLRAEHNYSHYLEESGLDNLRLSSAVVEEAMQLADPEFDFANVDSVMVVMPSSHFGGGTAGGRVTTDEGTVWQTTWINSFPSEEPGEPHQWGSSGAHELVHNLGLADLYPFSTYSHKRPYPPTGAWVETEIGLMGLDAYFHTSENDPRLAYRVLHPNGQRSTSYTQRLEATEMLAWSRWQLGWLKPDQIHCVTQLETETTITISPVALPGNEPAMVAIPITDTEVIVIESRRKLGYDAGREHQWSDGAETTFPGLPEEGVLVYTVNASLKGGQLPIKVAGDPGNGHLEREPILTEGESVTVGNYTITVQTSAHYTDAVTITKTNSP